MRTLLAVWAILLFGFLAAGLFMHASDGGEAIPGLVELVRE